jgi:hypothetical protein
MVGHGPRTPDWKARRLRRGWIPGGVLMNAVTNLYIGAEEGVCGVGQGAGNLRTWTTR